MDRKLVWKWDKNIQGLGMILALFSGLVAGTILANIIYARDFALIQPFIMDQYYVSAVRGIQTQRFAWNILPGRFGGILLFIILYELLHFSGICYITVVSVSFSWGFLISIEIIRQGIRGLLFGSMVLFPHSFCYVMAIASVLNYQEKHTIRKYAIPILWMLLALSMEVWLEPQLILRFLS